MTPQSDMHPYPFESILADGFRTDNLPLAKNAVHTVVHRPDDAYGFLHEAALIEYRGTLFASWYNCPDTELHGRTPIRGRRSRDDGKTWSDIETLRDRPDGTILNCPPVYGIRNGVLYLFMNTMTAPDCIHSLDLCRYNPKTGAFDLVWSRQIPFKLNTNLYELPNGKLLLAGRIAPRCDAFPDIPAVLIGDDGTCEGNWRIVPLTPDSSLPDGTHFIHPECSAVVHGTSGDITVFCRNDLRDIPLLFRSHDCGETWYGPVAHDLPFSNSKIMSGSLPDGGAYVVGNLLPAPGAPGRRSRLALFRTEPGSARFSSGVLLRNGDDPARNVYPQFSYPACCICRGHLLTLYSMVTEKGNQSRRGAMLTAVPL